MARKSYAVLQKENEILRGALLEISDMDIDDIRDLHPDYDFHSLMACLVGNMQGKAEFAVKSLDW